jgi:hypothetical protein
MSEIENRLLYQYEHKVDFYCTFQNFDFMIYAFFQILITLSLRSKTIQSDNKKIDFIKEVNNSMLSSSIPT